MTEMGVHAAATRPRSASNTRQPLFNVGRLLTDEGGVRVCVCG
jgi:hypothetical protein